MSDPALKDAPAKPRRRAIAAEDSPRSRGTRAELDLREATAAPPDPRRQRLVREVAGIGLLLAALFIAGALLFEHEAASCTQGAGIFGPVGACLRSGLFGLLGAPAAALLPLLPLVHGLRLLGR
ncbi:MAG: hypothetical protein HY275_03695, partial [Gemmatimonadetes bacterium]|nr:hypothetical protein [Gemmatimonadota bacterium]